MKYFAGFLITIYLITVGIFIGSTNNAKMFNDVKWTDIGTLLVTFLGFCFAFITYHQWLTNKRKEDSYLAAKRYLTLVYEIEEFLNLMLFNYNYMCPTPGLPIENTELSIKRIEVLLNIQQTLIQTHQKIYTAHRELAFWNVSLTNKFEAQHVLLNKKLHSAEMVSDCLTNHLHIFIKSDMSNMNDVIRHKEMFDDLCKSIQQITNQRVEMGFKSMFTFP